MTYFGFLARFLILPIIVLGVLTIRDWRRHKALPGSLQASAPLRILATLIVIALVYTTPWDNYLVATHVWWYDPKLVSGIIIGWVPLEEYTFFILQPILMGLWFLFLGRHLPMFASAPKVDGRLLSAAVVGLVWIASIVMLVKGWTTAKYLSIELAWALPPIILQLLVGATILWRQRWLVILTIVPMTLYLSVVDSIAISARIWTIDPQQSLNLLLGGTLPIEEFMFFLLTNTIVVFGLVLGLSSELRRSIRGLIRPETLPTT